MQQNQCTIQAMIKGSWQDIATLSLLGEKSEGFRAPCHFEYTKDHGIAFLGRNDLAAVSCRLPVHFGLTHYETWPPWALDLIPAGSAKQFWLNRLGLSNEPANSWALLTKGASNPPGALRIKEAAADLREVDHPGFSIDDVLFMKEGFIDHCEKHGSPVSGSSGAQGEAKKFLLTEDVNGRWHPACSVPEHRRQREWLVKWPRHRYDEDLWVLQAEEAYHHIAKELGFKKFGDTFFRDRCLFVERFDVVMEGSRKGQRLGLETLASAMGHVHFGEEPGHLAIIATINRFSSTPEPDVSEYILRDMFNLVLGNKDNHCRNTSFIKPIDGGIQLSPWYDFCPMVFDSVGVSRTNKWGEFEDSGTVAWQKLMEHLVEKKFISPQTALTFFDLAKSKLNRLLQLLPKAKIHEEILSYGLERCQKLEKELGNE